MRGKVIGKQKREGATRITPAYAGKSAHLSVPAFVCEDHPRLCGEKCAEPSIVVTIQGSPPPMRGKALDSRRSEPFPRITPAYAGKRSAARVKEKIV